MNKKAEAGYHYTACGLDDVYLVNLPIVRDRAGDATITIENINLLHECLCIEVALKEGGLNPKEIRFLRTTIGYTQGELAKLLHKDTQTIGRWERGETPIDGGSETLLRAVVLETNPAHTLSIREITEKVTPEPADHAYRIEASDPKDYRRAA